MKYLRWTAAFFLLVAFQNSSASDELDDKEVLSKRGNGTVSQLAFAARIDRIPANIRLETIRDPNRLRDIINNLLLLSQLAADARESGFDTNPVIKERMRLAADSELADAWIRHYVDSQPEADYEALAFESYQLNKKEMFTNPSIDVSHILISTKEHQPDEALALAESLQTQLLEDPSKFDDLVMSHSEDQSAKTNFGKFKGVERGRMVKAFENAAFALRPSEISDLVKSEYGYHLIRLDASHAPTQMQFEELKPQLLESARKKHDARNRRAYLETLTSVGVEMTEDQLQEMVKRQFGKEVLGTEVEDAKSE